MKEKVEKIIKKEIRPKLQSHNGDIEVVDIKENVVRIKLLGACSGCPTADFTRKDLIESTLKKELTWVESVEVVNEVSQDLLNQAKKIMRERKWK